MEDYSVRRLKGILRERGLTVSGSKHELILRIEESNKKLAQDEEAVSVRDSASQVKSVSSVNSSKSSRSSLLLKQAEVAAKRKSLEIQLKFRKEQEAVTREKLELEQKLDRLKIQSEFETAVAQEKIFASAEGIQNREFLSKIMGKEFLEDDTGESKLNSITKRSCSDLGAKLKQEKSKYLIDKDSQSKVIINNKAQENTLLETLATCNLKSLIPPQELKKFSGDYSDYKLFITTFNNVIADKLQSDQEKLHYLHQYTVGEPNEVVGSCLHLESTEGYKRACSMLEKRYGDIDQIVTSYINKILSWDIIKENDYNNFDKFSIALENCLNAVSGVDYGEYELNNPKNIRTILEKLSMGIRNKWRRKVVEIRDKNLRRANFKDLVSFMSFEARVMKEPLYGKHLFNTEDCSNGKRFNSNIRTNVNMIRGRLECWYCKQAHILDNCEQLKQISIEARIETLKQLNLCFKCLRHGHMSRFCPEPKQCRLCGSRYHPELLHIENSGRANDNNFNSNRLESASERSGNLFRNRSQNSRQNQDNIRRNESYNNTYIYDDVSKVNEVNKTFTVDSSAVRPKVYNNKGELNINAKPFTGTDIGTTVKSTTNKTGFNEMNQYYDSYVNSGMMEGKNKTIDINSMGVKIFTRKSVTGCTGMSVIPVTVYSPEGIAVKTNAFLDTGSSATLITESLMLKLGVKGLNETSLSVSTINGIKMIKSMVVEGIRISELDSVSCVALPTMYSVDSIPVDESDYLDKVSLKGWFHLSRLKIKHVSGEVGILIGSSAPHILEPLDVIRAPREFAPYAIRTRIGWAVCGATTSNDVKINKISISDEMLVKDYTRDFMDLSLIHNELSVEDKTWLEVVQKGCKIVNGKYEIPIPLREFHCMPDSKYMALNRMKGLKTKLLKNKLFAEKYIKFMDDMFLSKYAEPVLNEETSHNVWYIPHFGVSHPDKPEKVRVVFDCAAAVGGKALNDFIIQGPDLLNSLLGVMLRFRFGKYAFMADVETMFYQVGVPEHQRDLLRFFWWPENNFGADPCLYRMRVHLFGSVSSPSIANFAIKQTVADFGHLFSNNAQYALLNNFYVDDCLLSGDEIGELYKNALEIKDLCLKGGFNLTKFVFSERIVLENFASEDILSKDAKSFKEGNSCAVKALGVLWDLGLDSLSVPLNLSCELPLNKRQMLSLIASLYDPLGILAPFIIEGRLIVQEMCRGKLSWDEVLGDELSLRVKKWISKLNELSLISIKRCMKLYSLNEIKQAELHLFSDASTTAYGAVCYGRFLSVNGHISTSYILGKGRVAPLKSVSVPRLELTAAVLSVKLKLIIVKELKYKWDKIVFWTDSTCTLRYIENTKTRFLTFVANRSTFIRDGSVGCIWKYVSTSLNPADDVTRSCQSSRWLTGPEFLLSDEMHWPKELTLDINWGDVSNLEVRKEVNVKTTIVDACKLLELIERCSCWNKLLKLMGWLVLYVKFLQFKFNKGLSCDKILTPQILVVAELSAIKVVQTHFYSSEIERLGSGLEVFKYSSLVKLSPFLHNGVLRVGGRLKWAELEFNEKHPIIIPYRCHLAGLLVSHYHKKFCHAGRSLVLAQVRTKFWIIKCNSVVRKIISSCVVCRKARRKPLTQMMSDLPTFRVDSGKSPFYSTGVDCFGPFNVRRGRTSVKRYGVLFTCLTIRAVHLEVAFDLSASSFIAALRRFLARRGNIKTLICDQGTNFIGARNELSKLRPEVLSVIESQLLKERIEWKFNTPGASHHGGIWERMIGVVRRTLDVVLGSQGVDDEGLCTFFCEVEAVINSRPINVVTSDVDYTILSPNKLLNMSESSINFVTEHEPYSKKRWRQVQALADQFWGRWKREYLLNLQSRQKWYKPEVNIKVGSIVLIVDDSSPRCNWPMARVIKVRESRDGLVRSVELVKNGKIYNRPISKLVMVLEEQISC